MKSYLNKYEDEGVGMTNSNTELGMDNLDSFVQNPKIIDSSYKSNSEVTKNISVADGSPIEFAPVRGNFNNDIFKNV